MNVSSRYKYVEEWLERCLGDIEIGTDSLSPLKRTLAREVWACEVIHRSSTRTITLTIFNSDMDGTTNTNLSPADTAQKCALAMQELSHLGIPTATCLGCAIHNDAAAIVTEHIKRTTWQTHSRSVAARVLAKLHLIQAPQLSCDLQRLLRLSDPKQHRTTYWLFEDVARLDEQHPEWRMQYQKVASAVDHLLHSLPPMSDVHALVHGDYFSANIIPTLGEIRVIDWETCGWGDPMWDFAFLLGADGTISRTDMVASIRSYTSVAPIETEQLRWHTQCWDVSWQFRLIMRHFEVR